MIGKFLRFAQKQSVYKGISMKLRQKSSFGQFESEEVQGGNVEITDQCLEVGN